jgi:phasin
MTDIAVNAGAAPKAPPTTASPGISSDIPRTESEMFEFPVLFRGVSEASAEQAKENWRIMKAAAEKLASAVQDAYSITTRESMEYGMKVMETARANAAAALDLSNALIAAKSPSEVVELSSAHARRQLNLTVEQNRQLWAAAQKIATAILEPLDGGQHSKPPERRK